MRFLIFVKDLLQFSDYNNCQNGEDNMLLELRGAANIHFITTVPRAITQVDLHINLTRGKLVNNKLLKNIFPDLWFARRDLDSLHLPLTHRAMVILYT